MLIITKRVRSDNWLNGSEVSLSLMENLLKRYRTDGTVEATHGGGRAAKLSVEQETVLVTLVEEDNG